VHSYIFGFWQQGDTLKTVQISEKISREEGLKMLRRPGGFINYHFNTNQFSKQNKKYGVNKKSAEN
jgi:hypothetical protein